MDKEYTIRLIGDTLEVDFSKEMNAESVMDLRADIIRMSEDGPHDVLVNLTGTPANTAVPANLQEYFKDLPYKRYAIFGGVPPTLLLTKKLVESLPDDQNLRFFRTEDAARAWLEENNDNNSSQNNDNRV